MATATSQPEAPLVPVSEMLKTKAAEDTLRAVRQERRAVGATLARYRAALNPQAIDQDTDPAQMWDAKLHIAEAEREHARLSLAERTAQQAADDAREADRAELLATIADRLRPIVVEADRYFAAGCEKYGERIVALQLAAHELAGAYLDPICPWYRTAMHEQFRVNARAAKLLD